MLQTKGKTNKIQGDISIIIVTVILAVFGIFAVYSASGYTAKTQYGDSWYFAKKQAIGVIFGAVAMWLCCKFDYRKLQGKKIRVVALVVPMILLALVFVPGIGKSNYGATRWIGVGSVTIQPSELAKYGFVIFTSAYASERMEKMRTLKGVLPVLMAGGGICVLIMLEPNMSVTMCVGAVMIGMIFLAGISKKGIAAISVPVLLLVPVLIAMEPYRLQRLSAFVDPWASPKEE
ncbi:MAG: FtsW/RodA/SpoVE family cell cycle protein, partial [Clostridia bacterium]|nr:FtsW/RodA/SpoVE family cell cycle protein [Clostridia bacterium]